MRSVSVVTVFFLWRQYDLSTGLWRYIFAVCGDIYMMFDPANDDPMYLGGGSGGRAE